MDSLTTLIGAQQPALTPVRSQDSSASTNNTNFPVVSEAVLPPPPKKRQRKSRGRGLRTKSGCLTCRSRHKKCDEKLPICGPCSISSRDCVFPDDKLRALNNDAEPVATREAKQVDKDDFDGPRSFSGTRRVDLLPTDEPSPETFDYRPRPPSTSLTDTYDIDLSSTSGSNDNNNNSMVLSESWTTNFASTRWLDLLATDAAHNGFSMIPGLGVDPTEDLLGASNRVPSGLLGPGDRELLRPFHVAPEKHNSWQIEQDIRLSDYDSTLFRNFAQRSALWLDVLDPHRHFSTYAIRLALRNPGLMRAILALSARHRSLLNSHSNSHSRAMQGNVVDDGDLNKSIQYYYETIHYVQTALQYNTYTHSEELLATALVISTYEMLDESDGRGNWQRHLKGVFWIQRSQEVNGASGGIRQAVWWAWLRQDIWAAFRENRRCLSFWRPVKDYKELNKYELAGRSVYLLSQAVNYSAESKEMEKTTLSATDEVTRRRIEMGDTLLAMLERWKSSLGDDFRPLPSPSRPEDVFRPLWIHPPDLAVALQVHSFARILIMLHRPASSGFHGYLRVQRTLSEAVDTICGIAMELKDEACQILSAQCLYGAGLCVQDNVKRNFIISMMEDCEDSTGWPMAAWREDLQEKWAKADSDYHESAM